MRHAKFALMCGAAAALFTFVAALPFYVRRTVTDCRKREASQRAKCLADGGRIVPVHGGKYSAWICDLPRNVEVQP